MANIINHKGRRYTVVTDINDIPGAYTVWNIGVENAPPGHIPFCRLSQRQPFPDGRSVDMDALMAVPCHHCQPVMDAAGYGGGTPAEIFAWLHANYQNPHKADITAIFKAALRVYHDMGWRGSTNFYD